MRAFIVLALAVLLNACGDSPAKFTATDITGASFAHDFKLTDHTGKPRTLADFRGKAVVVFFGFTQCPDVCPTTLSNLAQVMQLLGKDGERLQVLFITLDPERDTQALLSRYVPQFHPSFIGLYADASGTQAVAKDFKVFFQKTASGGANYTIDHATGAYVFDPAGRVRLYAEHNAKPDQLAGDIRQLLAGK